MEKLRYRNIAFKAVVLSLLSSTFFLLAQPTSAVPKQQAAQSAYETPTGKNKKEINRKNPSTLNTQMKEKKTSRAGKASVPRASIRTLANQRNEPPTKSEEALILGFGVFFLMMMIGGLIVSLIFVVSWYKLFQKTGVSGWEAFVPLLNLYRVNQICEIPSWVLILVLVPYFFPAYYLWVWVNLAKAFDRSAAFTLGLIFAPYLFLPVLAFDNSIYRGRGGNPGPENIPYRMVS